MATGPPRGAVDEADYARVGRRTRRSCISDPGPEATVTTTAVIAVSRPLTCGSQCDPLTGNSCSLAFPPALNRAAARTLCWVLL